MDYQVIVAPSARRDLRQIVRYISQDSPERAENFGRRLLSATRRLAGFPEIGREVPEFGDPMLREIVTGSYRIIYRVDDVARIVGVIRFWHAARGTPRI